MTDNGAASDEEWLSVRGALADAWDGEPAEVAIRRIRDNGPVTDEFDEYLREQMRDPVFRAAYEVAERRAGRSGWYDGPLGAIETLGVLVARTAKRVRGWLP